MATKAHLEGNLRYLQTQDEIRFRMSKESGMKAKITAIAKLQGESVNKFISIAVDERIMKLQDSM